MAAVFSYPPFAPHNFQSSTNCKRLIDLPEIAGVFRGRELTRKQCRVLSGVASLDNLLDGGIVRGRISEFIGPTGVGKTSLAMAFAAQVTRDEAAGWIEAGSSFDPASMLAAGIEPARMLWVSGGKPLLSRSSIAARASADDAVARWKSVRRQTAIACLKAAEWILAAGGFGLLVIDFGDTMRFIPQSSALRLARIAERSGAAILILAQARLCSGFAALSLSLQRRRTCFSNSSNGAPATFDGQVLEARVLHNKLGGSGGAVTWSVVADPASASLSAASTWANQSDRQLRLVAASRPAG